MLSAIARGSGAGHRLRALGVVVLLFRERRRERRRRVRRDGGEIDHVRSRELLRALLIAVVVGLGGLELTRRREDAGGVGEHRAVERGLHGGLVVGRFDAERSEARFGTGTADAVPRYAAPERARLAGVELRRELHDDPSLVTREEGSHLQLHAILRRRRVGADGAHETHALRKREVRGRSLDRRRRRLLELAAEEGRQRRRVLHEREVAVTGARDRAHVALVEVEADAHRRHHHARLEARAGEALRLDAGRVEPVADEHDAADAPAPRDLERAHSLREPLGDGGAAACAKPAHLGDERLANASDARE